MIVNKEYVLLFLIKILFNKLGKYLDFLKV